MAYLDKDELHQGYTDAKTSARAWREDYHEYERLANNELIEDMDENLPETNDGSLAASLFKLPKRIVNSNLEGRAKALDRGDAWLTELANLQWKNNIIPNANSQAPFHRKWKDAVRKAAIYGSVPIINLFVERGSYKGSDFIVGMPQDVTLESGKISDYDSDVIWWDIYYTKLQWTNLIETAKKEVKEAKDEDRDSYNKWDVKAMEEILKTANAKEQRPSTESVKQQNDKAVEHGGIKLCVAFQRGINAPFYMYHPGSKTTVREWSNPDPTGDIPVHFLYCYQDFVNPYGIGIVKLAGGTQNVLDYMRQADVLATQMGLRPPIEINGDADSVDIDSLVYAQDALWFTGNAQIKRQELGNGVYQDLPNRIGMYKTSLNQMLPMGDIGISGSNSGDPNTSKTPAGVKFAEQSLSIDDEDFKDNLYMTYAAVARSMINTHFANMTGTGIMKLNDEEREVMAGAGIQFPMGPDGQPTNELEIIWDDAREEFDFEVDTEADKMKDDARSLEGLMTVLELVSSDPNIDMELQMVNKRLNRGELLSEIIGLTSDNDKILVDLAPEDQMQPGVDPMGNPIGQPPMQPGMPQGVPMEQPQIGMPQPDPSQVGNPEEDAQAEVNIQAVMKEHGVDEETAAIMLEAERQGHDPNDIINYIRGQQ